MQRRRRSVPHSFEDQIEAEKARLKMQVDRLPPGPQQDALLRQINQLEIATNITKWLKSSGLQSPK
jgi:hypothetical protein